MKSCQEKKMSTEPKGMYSEVTDIYSGASSSFKPVLDHRGSASLHKNALQKIVFGNSERNPF